MCHDTYSKLYETSGTIVYGVSLYLCEVNESDYYDFLKAEFNLQMQQNSD